eukprot:scaffold1172_cov409-Prasinococcus_capsulatus_cf.AAC.11
MSVPLLLAPAISGAARAPGWSLRGDAGGPMQGRRGSAGGHEAQAPAARRRQLVGGAGAQPLSSSAGRGCRSGARTKNLDCMLGGRLPRRGAGRSAGLRKRRPRNASAWPRRSAALEREPPPQRPPQPTPPRALGLPPSSWDSPRQGGGASGPRRDPGTVEAAT